MTGAPRAVGNSGLESPGPSWGVVREQDCQGGGWSEKRGRQEECQTREI